MSAAEYYNSGPGASRPNTDLPPLPPPPPPPPPHSPSPSPPPLVSPIDKPPPHQPGYPTHSVAGYNDGFFGRHHSTNSVEDTSYHPHPAGPSAGYYANDDYDKHDPFHDAIPLNDTHPSQQHQQYQQYQHQPLDDFTPLPPPQPVGKKKRRPGQFLFSSRTRPRPWACWILSAIQISIFIAEIARNSILTGSPIAIRPQFNPMIGPSPYVLINMGARFVPCMKTIVGVTDQPELTYQCPNTTTTEAGGCSLGQLCGFGGDRIPEVYGGVSDRTQPDQWWRFVVPIFLHAGLVHIGFNMVIQLYIGSDMEREIGTLRFVVCYFASGIFGFVLGGNFAPDGILSTGCSGSLFGIIALLLLDLVWNWSQRPSPGKELLFLLLDIAIGFAIGLLPGLDNFSHIGGFCMGLILGAAVLRSPLSMRAASSGPPYTPMATMHGGGAGNGGVGGGRLGGMGAPWIKRIKHFFQGRKPVWWFFWIVRAGLCTLALVAIIVLVNNFYMYRRTCSWCKYLSCLPVSDWCEQGGLTVTQSTNPARKLLMS